MCCRDSIEIFRKECVPCVSSFGPFNHTKLGTTFIECTLSNKKLILLEYFLEQGLSPKTILKNKVLINYVIKDIHIFRMLIDYGLVITDKLRKLIIKRCHVDAFFAYFGNSIQNNINGESPIFYAVKCRNTCFLRILMQEKMPVNIRDVKGTTPLMYAAMYGPVFMVKMLIHFGADKDMLDDMNNSVLHYAAQNIAENSECIDYLLSLYKSEIKTKINAKNKCGKTPLHYATELSNSAYMCEYLLDNGATLSEDIWGMTPLDYVPPENMVHFARPLYMPVVLNNGRVRRDRIFIRDYETNVIYKTLMDKGRAIVLEIK